MHQSINPSINWCRRIPPPRYKSIAVAPSELLIPLPNLIQYPKTYLGAGDGDLDLAAGSGDDGGELVADAGQEAQAVVLGEGLEEVLDRLVAGAGLLGELLDDGLLVGLGQGRRREDGDQLGVLLEEGAEVGEGRGGGIEVRGLDGGSVLN